MSAAQAQLAPSSGSKKAPLYPFLSQPPPQKKRPTQPLPSPPSNAKTITQPNVPAIPCTPPAQGRRRSATTSAITAWISNVHPGSPAPCSPRRSPSVFSRRPSLTRSIPRRPSVTSIRVSSASFLNISDTPTTPSKLVITPSMKDFSPSDFAKMGYTSFLVQLPSTPQAPSPHAKEPKRTLKHFRSLSALKPSRRARTEPVATTTEKKSSDVTAIKKSKYAKYRPAPLTNDLALAQLMDGGRMDDHASRFVRTEAKAAGAVKVDGQLVGVGGVWKDGEGGIWRDRDEELEYAHLLGGRGSYLSDGQWVKFGSEAGSHALSPLVDERRRSLSTQDSDLSPRYAMKAEADTHDDLDVFGGAIAHTIRVKPGLSVLAIPSRSRRTAKHLRKPEFLLDVFPIPSSPTRVPKSPASPRFAAKPTVTMPSKARKRPAPLKLIPPSPAFKCPTNPADSDTVRRDFLDDSFVPTPIEKSPRHVVPARAATVPVKATATKSIQLNMKGILKVMGGKKPAML
ncbi:hypothetical protein BXZ70DRAFT_601558 [Cristinia sonorae]|uniref:Uncharacterized protein n=1 Tax=Cristinia sonorae TaxID=1940300 RepID=A0A8K0UUP1_9AGAR|nr:hypothetical protein BXZ70DRAFT_601558 [Cristinia sonorae]